MYFTIIVFLIAILLYFITKPSTKAPPYSPLRFFPVRLINDTILLFNDFNLKYGLSDWHSLGNIQQSWSILGHVYIILGPDLLRWAFKGDTSDNYLEWDLPAHWKGLLGEKSIFNSKGEEHKRLRRILSSAFTPKALSGYTHYVTRTTKEFLSTLSNNESVWMQPKIKEYAMNIALRVILGEDMTSDTRLRNMLSDYIVWLNGLAALIPFKIPGLALYNAYLAKHRIYDTLMMFVKERRGMRDVGQKDVLQNLINTEDEDGFRLDDDTIAQTLIGFIFAGHDTSTSSINSALYCLSIVNSEFKQKLENEVKTVLGNEDITFDKLNQMEYLDAFIKETFRYLPPIPAMARTMTRDMEVEGYIFKKGQVVSLDYLYLMHDEKYYKNPSEFKPERFFEEIKPYTYVPFGGGARICLGMGLAKLELKCFIVEVIRSFEYTVDDKKELTFLFYMVEPKCTLRAK